MKIITIPFDIYTQLFDMRKSRGYISIRYPPLKFYHKFRDYQAFIHWYYTTELVLAWGDTVSDLIRL